MKNKTAASVKEQNVTLRDLKIKKDPKGGYKLTTLPHEQPPPLPTLTCIDPHL
jgi:hypothetical protein